jgi:thiopurine S-methyltransferase
MSKINWQDKWEQGQIGFHQSEINSDLVNYMSRYLEISEKNDFHIFVPLCGKTSDMLWLKERSKHIYGVELSPLALLQFSEENKLGLEKDLTPTIPSFKNHEYTLYQGDYFNLTKDHLPKLTHVYDRASIIALPQSIRKKYAEHLSEVIAAPYIFLITIDYDQEKVQGPPYSVPQNEIYSYYSKDYNIQIEDEVAITDGLPPRFSEQNVTIKKTVYFMTRKNL